MLQIIFRFVALASVACLFTACSARNTAAPPHESVSSETRLERDRRSMKGWELYCLRDEADPDVWRFALMEGTNMYVPEKWRGSDPLDVHELKNALHELRPGEYVTLIPVSDAPPIDLVDLIANICNECEFFFDSYTFSGYGNGS